MTPSALAARSLMLIVALSALVQAADPAPVAISYVDLTPAYPFPGWTGHPLLGKEAYETRFAPEIPEQAAGVKWMKEVALNDGQVDLQQELNHAICCATYARVTLESSAETKVRIRMGADDGVGVIINGKKVFSVNQNKGLNRNEHSVEAALNKGVNTILFRVVNAANDYGLQFNITPLDGATVTQIDAP